MDKFDPNKLIPLLRRLAMIMASDRGHSPADIQKAKTLATRLYVMHTNREINLEEEEFHLLLDIIQFDPSSLG
jgi:hypothetical protein